MKKKVSAILLVLLAAFCLLPGIATAEIKECNVPDISWWLYNLADNQGLTDKSYEDKAKVMVFLNRTCPNSQASIRALAASKWATDDRIQIIAVCLNGTDAEIQQFKNTYAANCGNIIFAKSNNNINVWRDYMDACEINGGTFPFNFAILNGKILYTWEACNSIRDYDTAFNKLLNEEVPDVYQFKINGVENYTEAYDVLAELNAHRMANGRQPLYMDEKLLEAAMQRAAESAVYYGGKEHTRPDGSVGLTVIQGNVYKAENIAVGYSNASAVMAGWKSSVGHNENMLNNTMTAAGVGCFEYDGVKYWVQLFSSADPSMASKPAENPIVLHDILALPQYLKLQAAPAAVTVQPGETAVLKLNNSNLNYNNKTGVIHATYAKISNENVASVTLSGEQVQIKGLADGVTTLKLGGVASRAAGAPYTIEVKITVGDGVETPGGDTETPGGDTETPGGDTETPGERFKLTLNSDKGNIGGTGKEIMSVDVVQGKAYRLPIASKSGFTLQYWSDGKNNYKANTDYVVAHDTELIAVWQRNSSSSSGGSSSHRPGNTTKPTQPEKPTEPTKPAESVKPAEPSKSLKLSAAELNAAVGEVTAKYDDVKTDDWYAEAVAFVYKQGMMNGLSDKRFAPGEKTTRAMLVTMLYRLEKDAGGSAATKFSDVPAGQWFSDAVNWSASVGVVNGMENGKFAPNDNISREQLAAILYRYAQYKGYDVSVKGDLSKFNDNGSIAAWAKEPMQWAVGSGLINGKGEASLEPGSNATRAEVATMLMRLLNQDEK